MKKQKFLWLTILCLCMCMFAVTVSAEENTTLETPELEVENIASSGKIALDWDSVDDAVSYKVYYSTSQNGTYSLLKTVTGSKLNHTSAKAGQIYYYYVVAVASDGTESVPSNTVKRTCDLPRPTLTLGNNTTTGKVTISWTEVPGAVKYEVYRSTNGGESYTKLSTTAKTGITNTSAVAGVTYRYKVRAIASNSSANSAYSPAKDRTCDLPRPTISVSNKASTGKIVISWEAIEGATKYQIYRSTDGGKNYSLLSTTTKTSITNTSAVAGQKYYYKVKAICSNSNGNSAYSSYKYRVCDLPRPDVDISLTAGGKPILLWEGIDGAISYKVYRATSSGGDYKLLKTVTDGTLYVDASAKAGTKYYYKVKAICSNSSGNSAYSVVDSIKATKPAEIDEYSIAACALDTCYELAYYPSSVSLKKAYYLPAKEYPYPVVVIECSAENTGGGYSSIYVMALYLTESDYEAGYFGDYHLLYYIDDSFYIACTAFEYDPFEDYSEFTKLNVDTVIDTYEEFTFY